MSPNNLLDHRDGLPLRGAPELGDQPSPLTDVYGIGPLYLIVMLGVPVG